MNFHSLNNIERVFRFLFSEQVLDNTDRICMLIIADFNSLKTHLTFSGMLLGLLAKDLVSERFRFGY